MLVFFTLFQKLLPLYFIILLGYISTRFLTIRSEAIAELLIYIITPTIIFNGITKLSFTPSLLLIPIAFWIVGATLCLTAYWIAGKLWSDSTRNIFAFASGTGNMGYFGIPVAVALFGSDSVGIVALAVVGIVLYETSLGYYITARGSFSRKESFRKVVRLPSLYALILGFVVKSLGFSPGPIFNEFSEKFIGCYAVLGMMLIGMGLRTAEGLKFDVRFVALLFGVKFLVWPLLIGGLLLVDSQFFNLLDKDVHHILLLVAVVPLAANTVAYAAALKAQPEKAAIAVLLSTVVALFYIPLIAVLFF